MVDDALISEIWRPFLGLTSICALWYGCLLLARRGFGQSRGLPAWLAAAVLFWASGTIALEGLSFWSAISTAGLLGVGFAGLIVGLCLPRGRVEAAAPTPPGSVAWEWSAIMSVGLLLTAAVPLAMQSLVLAVKVVSDGPIYHLYFAARWWRAGRLILVAAPFGESAATYFPANGDLWFTWLFTIWGGDRLARIGQTPFLVLAALAAYGLARSAGLGRSASVIATCWFAGSAPLLLFSFTPNVDTIFVAGLLLAGFFFQQFALDQGGESALVLGALAAGLALGTKAVGVVFVPPLLVLGLVIACRADGSRGRKIVRSLVIGLMPLLTGGYWFFRNAWLTGNPLYPLQVVVMGKVVLAGWYGPAAMRKSLYYIPLGDWRAFGDILLAVVDPRLAPVWLAALAAAILAALPRGSRPGVELRRDRLIAAMAALAIANIALYWIFIPYRSQQRFMLQALGFAVSPLAALIDRGRWARLIAAALLGVHLLSAQSWPFAKDDRAIPWDLTLEIPNAVEAPAPLSWRWERAFDRDPRRRSATGVVLLAVVALAAVGAAASLARVQGPGRRGRRRLAAVAGSAALLGAGLADLGLYSYDARIRFYPPFLDFYRGWMSFDVWCGPRGARVAYAGTNLPYYLLGDRLRNEVRYVNINDRRDFLLHDYHREALARGEGVWPNSRPGWDRMNPDYRAWVRNLEAERIDLLVVTRVNSDEGAHNIADSEGFPIERGWADGHPDRFEPLYGELEADPWFRIYRFRKPPWAGATTR